MAARLSLCLAAALLASGLAMAGDTGKDGVAEREARLAYYERIAAIHQWLGIPVRYAEESRLRLKPEAPEVVSIGSDPYGRDHHLAPEAALAWAQMSRAAARDGIEFVVVSSFRSVDYQAELIQRRLDEGRARAQIFHSIALPGYSEHHTGCALDLVSEEHPGLGPGFRDTEAYQWLREHAGKYGFRESYPHGNQRGIMAEPWHWYYAACAAVRPQGARLGERP